MKKSIFTMLMLALFATSFVSCSKDDEEKPAELGSNSWVINGLTYKTPTLLPPSFSGNNFTASSTDNGGGVLSISFPAKPTTSKNYTVVLAGSSALGADECRISVTNANDPKIFVGTGRAGDVVSVTVTGGKVAATATNVEMLYLVGSTENKTTISAKLSE